MFEGSLLYGIGEWQSRGGLWGFGSPSSYLMGGMVLGNPSDKAVHSDYHPVRPDSDAARYHRAGWAQVRSEGDGPAFGCPAVAKAHGRD